MRSACSGLPDEWDAKEQTGTKQPGRRPELPSELPMKHHHRRASQALEGLRRLLRVQQAGHQPGPQLCWDDRTRTHTSTSTVSRHRQQQQRSGGVRTHRNSERHNSGIHQYLSHIHYVKQPIYQEQNLPRARSIVIIPGHPSCTVSYPVPAIMMLHAAVQFVNVPIRVRCRGLLPF